MVNYENPDLFYEHETTHLIIVNSGATVTGRANTTPLIEDDTFCLTEDNITEEEFEVRESLCSRDNLKFGTMEASCFMVDIFDSDDIPHLKDEEIDVYIYFDDDSSTLFKIGRYIVDKDSFSDDRETRSIVAYDLIYYLRDYDITEWYNTVYEGVTVRTIKYLRDSLFAWLDSDMEDYTIEQEETDLINDDWEVEKSINSDTVTFGFWMERIAEANGVFPHINRQGVFCYIGLKWYDEPAVKTFDDEQILPPVKYGGSDKDITVWGIAYVVVYDGNNKRLAYVGSTSKKYPSRYYIVDSFVFTNNRKQTGWKTDLKAMLAKLREAITHLRYKPFEGGFYGNLCYEVGDRIDVDINTYDEETDGTDDNVPIVKQFYTYILERTFVGFNDFEDTYSAKGDKKQPKYKVNKNKWNVQDTDTATSGDGTGGVQKLENEETRKFFEMMRNLGVRILDEPSNVEVIYNKQDQQVEIKWTDPPDIDNYKPHKCVWAGTVIVRKLNTAPIHKFGGKYGGDTLVTSTTRDEYSEDAYVDNTIEPDKRYYYGIFPYYISMDDDHNLRHYTPLTVYSVDTEHNIEAPKFTALGISGTTLNFMFEIAELDIGTYEYCKLVVKKGGIPTSVTDGNKIITLQPTDTEASVSDLDENSKYYAIIFVKDSTGVTAESESAGPMKTGVDEGWTFNNTGAIQEWTAPKTGIYQLETWGAQGGDATDGTNSARGGYGAYAVGEVFLTQGDTLYINVGGQNGYGGGGKLIQEHSLVNVAKTMDASHLITQNTWTPNEGGTVKEHYLTDYILAFGDLSHGLNLAINNGEIVYNTGSNVNVIVEIPIPRMYVSKIVYDCKISSSVSSGGIIAGGSKIVDGNRVSVNGSSVPYATSTTYTTVERTYNDVFDYVVLYSELTSNIYSYFNNIKIYGYLI